MTIARRGCCVFPNDTAFIHGLAHGAGDKCAPPCASGQRRYRRSPAFRKGHAIAVRLAPLTEADPDQVETLLDAAFGPDRRSRAAYRLRESARPIAALSLAAFDGAALAGVLQSWPIALEAGGEAWPLVLVGPVAVAPDRQQTGLGRRMMAAMLARADAEAIPLMLVGDPEYYGRFFGFDAAPAAGWRMPGPVKQRRVLARLPEGLALPADGWLAARAPAIAGAADTQ